MDATRPIDLITQREAAELVGRNVDTVRRWRREYNLGVWRDDNPTAPAMVSKSQVLSIAGRIKPARRSDRGIKDERLHGEVSADAYRAQLGHIGSLEAHINASEKQVADLLQQRAEMSQYIEILRDESSTLKAELAEKDKRLAVLEVELRSIQQTPSALGLLSGAAKIGRRFFS